MSFLFRRKPGFRRVGDHHRSEAEWRLAADAYGKHLAERPGDGPIWVQLGHAEKEDGDLAAAEAAYRRASELMKDDADVRVHLGHLLKLQGRKADALEIYRSLFRLQPDPQTLVVIRDLIMRPGIGMMAARSGTIAFALEDFFQSFEQHATTTGIQRVQVGVVTAAIADASIDALFFICGCDESGESALFSLDRRALASIIEYASGDAVDHPVLQMMIMEARLSAVPLSLGAGCTIVHLGSFWSENTGIADYLVPLGLGARLVLFVHDVIPVTHPEFCESNLSRVFWQRLAELLYAADFIMTNSDHTQSELKRFMADHGCRKIAMQTVPLAHANDERALTVDTARAPFAAVRGKRYVAYVSTVEGRKNHIYVVRAWQRMIAENVDVPDLVFVGRVGWKTDELAALLSKTDNLGKRVYIMHGLSDGELDAVYRGAEFTVFTSFAEGWGLPVGESLSRGVPCIAAHAGAIPEVGTEFVDYVDPFDLDDGVAAFRRMIEDNAYRKTRRETIRARFVARTWHDVGTDVLRVVMRHRGQLDAPKSLPAVVLREGALFDPGKTQSSVVPIEGQLANPMSLAMASAFYEPEAHGAWLRGSAGEMTFATAAAPGEAVVILLKISAAHWATGQFSVSLTNSRSSRRWMNLAPGGWNLVRLKGHAGPDRNCTLAFAYDGEPKIHPGDHRQLAIALNAIGYARHSEAGRRLDLREQFTIGICS